MNKLARPKKQTVDYFPHLCSHGKTMFILEQKYGNDGYAFWFKLLEILGSTEGHYIRLENLPAWEFLQAKTHIDQDKCLEILDLLANLEAIDDELWRDYKVIWSDNFISNIAEAYKKRIVDLPQKPSFRNQKPTSEGVSTSGNPAEIDSTGISTDINPQMKLNEMKLNEMKVDETLSKESVGTPAKTEKHKHGIYGWIRITTQEYNKLLCDLGEKELSRCIAYIDESAQSSGNKNKWKDWNLVIRKCSREQWGTRGQYLNNKSPTVHKIAWKDEDINPTT